MTRVINDDPTKALRYGKPVLPSHILETFMDWRLYGHLVAAMLSMVMIAPMNTYAPSIIKSLGFTKLQANGLNSVGSVCALILSISLAYSSDKFRERGLHIAAGYLCGAAGLLWLSLAPSGVGKWTLYGKLQGFAMTLPFSGPIVLTFIAQAVLFGHRWEWVVYRQSMLLGSQPKWQITSVPWLLQHML